ncbi:UPF0158 family protein [Geomicrobium halophilum]
MEWHKEERQLEDAIIDDFDTYVPVPEGFEINDYHLMETFIATLESEHKQEKLARTIQGKGAFRRFKDLVIELNVADEWYDYQEQQ